MIAHCIIDGCSGSNSGRLQAGFIRFRKPRRRRSIGVNAVSAFVDEAGSRLVGETEGAVDTSRVDGVLGMGECEVGPVEDGSVTGGVGAVFGEAQAAAHMVAVEEESRVGRWK